MHHYCVYTHDPRFLDVLVQLRSLEITLEPHINRTRFYLNPETVEHFTLLLAYSDSIHCIDHESDHAIGI
jgi:hypothetical protein